MSARAAGAAEPGVMALLRHGWRALGAVAARRHLMVALCGIVTFAGCLLIDMGRERDPLPAIHDEYGYLLEGETFSRGRLTNPTHPLWRSMETFHELQRPTYQAKYPPGQGLLLALGTALGGRPIVGVWTGCSLFAAALCWMLQGWFPARWAVLGAACGVARMVFCGKASVAGAMAYWSQSYWGGAAAALGGALVVGGLGRVIGVRGVVGRGERALASAAMGAGAGVLALTRPFEGLLVVAAAGVVWAWWVFEGMRSEGAAPARVSRSATADARARRHTRGTRIGGTVLPGAVVVAVALGWLGLYNQRVTGSALRLPYMEYRERYQVLPIWRWQAVREEPVGLNPVMRAYARRELELGMRLARPWQRAKGTWRTLVFEVGPVLAVAMVVLLPWTARGRGVGPAAGMAAFVIAGIGMSTFYEIHYHAPAAGLTVVLATAALRRIGAARLRIVDFGSRIGRVAAAGLVLATLVSVGVAWGMEGSAPRGLMAHWGAARQAVVEQLEGAGGRHVVFVRYPPEGAGEGGARHSPDVELVFNGAEPDAQAVVWVRELEAEQNAAVLRHYAGRTAWLMEIVDDQKPARVTAWGR